MTNQNNSSHKASNFWFGFSLGLIAAASASYFLGTKKGREKLTKLIELSEDLPENVHKLLNSYSGDKNSKDSFHKLENLETIIKKIKKNSS